MLFRSYTAWLRRMQDHRPESPRVDHIEIVGLQRVNPEAVERHLDLKEGAPLDTDRLERDLLRVFGDGWYEGVDYSLANRGGRNVLRIAPVEKAWGPDYLRLAITLNSTLSQGSTYSLRAGYQKTWLNALGGEFLATGEIGSNSEIGRAHV